MRGAKLIIAGVFALFIGALIYLTDRPAGIFIEIGFKDLLDFGPAKWWLPDAIHPFAMSLICAGIARGSRDSLRFWAFFWALINILMEMGQYFAKDIEKLLSFFSNPLIRRLKLYFINGSFDPMDIAGILMGSAAALALSFAVKDKKQAI